MAMLANRLSRLVSEAAFPRLSSSFHDTTPFLKSFEFRNHVLNTEKSISQNLPWHLPEPRPLHREQLIGGGAGTHGC